MEDIFIRWSQQLADNQNLRELYYRGLHDFESLEGADLVGFGILDVRAVSTLRGSLLSTLGGASGCTRVVWVGSGNEGAQRISGSSGLVAFTLPLVP